jgi:hypothetical protein
MPVPVENSKPDVLMLQAAQDRHAHDRADLSARGELEIVVWMAGVTTAERYVFSRARSSPEAPERRDEASNRAASKSEK